MSGDAQQWLGRRTFHHEDFADVERLRGLKQAQGVTISVGIPTLNEAPTLGPILRAIRERLMDEAGLVDELAIIDSQSTDGTVGIAEAERATVYQDREILPDLEPSGGKGEALWKSLFVLRGDLIAWIDADIENFDPRFVYGLLGPLLTDPDIGYVKAFYQRPLRVDGGTLPSEGGRVTELVARPLINMFWPHLAGLLQPLSGEYAGRRSVLEQVPFFTHYAVELGLVVDVTDRFGLDALAQVDLVERVHRNRPLEELAPMAFAILQAALRRVGTSDGLASDTGRTLHLPVGDQGEYRMSATEVRVVERPPAASLAEYRGSR
ncbi:MAG: glucosyl-3-phosphoglycerate synthase [Actinomycetota bacterium]